MSHSIFPFLATVLFFVPLFHFLWFSHFVCPPGVARVKLTRPDKDNSLTHSVVYFSPLLFPLFHSTLLWSLTPLPYTLLFNCHRLFISSASIHPSYILFSSLAGNLFYSVISLSHCLLLHTRPSSSITPAICLSFFLSVYVCLATDPFVFLCICTSHWLSSSPSNSTFSNQSPPFPFCARA